MEGCVTSGCVGIVGTLTVRTSLLDEFDFVTDVTMRQNVNVVSRIKHQVGHNDKSD